MRITSKQLKQIIKEELGHTLREQKGSPARMAYYDWYDKVVKKPAWSMESDLKNKRYMNYPFEAEPNFDEEHGFPRSVKAHLMVAKRPNHPFHEFGKKLAARLEKDLEKDAKQLRVVYTDLQEAKKNFESFKKVKAIFDNFTQNGKVQKGKGAAASWKEEHSNKEWNILVNGMEFSRDRIRKEFTANRKAAIQALKSNDPDTASAIMDKTMDTRMDQEYKRSREYLLLMGQFYTQALQSNMPVEENLFRLHKKQFQIQEEYLQKIIQIETKYYQSIKKQFNWLQQMSGD